MSALQEQAVQMIRRLPDEDVRFIISILTSFAPPDPVVPRRSIIGAAKGEFTLPPDFEERSRELDREIAREFYGE